MNTLLSGLKPKGLALFCAMICACAVAVRAQSNQALLDILIRKGILTQAEAEQVQAEAKASVIAPPKAATAINKTVIRGKLYFDVSSINARNAAGTKVDPSGVGSDVKRFYVEVDHDFNDMWSAVIRSDAAYSGSTGTTAVYIKSAYIKARFSPEAIVEAGSADMPWIPFVENLYGLRYVENSLTDRMHVGNAADWGVHFLGERGMVSYSFAAVNGGGFKHPDRSKTVDFAGRISIEPIKGLTAAIGGYCGKLAKDGNGITPTRDASRLDVLVAYVSPAFRIGGEYFAEDNWGYTAGVQSDKGEGFGGWTTVKIAGPYSAFARCDIAKPSKDLNPDMTQDYYNIGLQWAAMAGLDVSLVYKDTEIDRSPSAGTVTSTHEFGLFAQAAF